MLDKIFVTKMCHDLAGTIGTLNNTTELLAIDTSFVNDGIGLLKQSTSVLVARLKFFRALLGLDMEINADIAKSYLETLPMIISVEGIINKREHLAFVLLASEILIRGGHLQIGETGFVCTGKTLLLDEVKKRILLDGLFEAKPQYAAALWLSDWMNKNNTKAEIFQNEEALSVRFLLKDK